MHFCFKGIMFALPIFAILVVTMAPVTIAQTLGAHPVQQSTAKMGGSPEIHAESAAASSSVGATATIDPAKQSETRGKPRVSRTRCAFVGCEPQCNIKGTRDARGDLVYLTPASPVYSQANAEKMFCSRADAKEAGYREEQPV